MKPISFLILIIIVASSVATAQDFVVKRNNPPIPHTGNVEWGNDRMVTGSEPHGRPSGVYVGSTSTIYVSVPDTTIQSGAAIVILASTNDGMTWSNIAGLTPASVISKTKMVATSLDSVYCFFISNDIVYCWNVLKDQVNYVRGPSFRDFDVASSSTGHLYIFLDSLNTNSIPRYSSIDGGATWGQRALVTSAGAHPRIYFSATGDTLILNYYGPVLADTATSIIRGARYRETGAGTLATAGSFINIVALTERKDEYLSVRHGGLAWFVYTAENGGNVDIKCKYSTNGGNSYIDSSVIASLSSVDELWMDAKHHNRGDGGIDVIYYSSAVVNDGLGPQMNYISASKTSPLSFTSPAQFADNAPVLSIAGYIPTLIPYYDSEGDAGAIWVGNSNSSGAGSFGIYFDKLLFTSVLNLTVNLEACSPMQDTVTVELRSATSPYALVDSKKGYLSGSGTAAINFTNALNGESYYIVVKHRNSVETWSKSGGETFANGQLTYDFTTAASQAFGNNQVLVSGEYSIFTGDVNQDGFVDASDGSLIDNDAFNFVSGYVPTDLNCDMSVDGTDAVYAENNAFNFVGKITP